MSNSPIFVSPGKYLSNLLLSRERADAGVPGQISFIELRLLKSSIYPNTPISDIWSKWRWLRITASMLSIDPVICVRRLSMPLPISMTIFVLPLSELNR